MFNESNERLDLKTFSYNYNHRHDEISPNYIAVDAENGINTIKKNNTIKIYLVCDEDYCGWSIVLKGFTSLQKAFDYATDVVMERNTKYNRDYIRKIIEHRYTKGDVIPDLFIYTDYFDMDYDRYITIKEINVD